MRDAPARSAAGAGGPRGRRGRHRSAPGAAGRASRRSPPSRARPSCGGAGRRWACSRPRAPRRRPPTCARSRARPARRAPRRGSHRRRAPSADGPGAGRRHVLDDRSRRLGLHARSIAHRPVARAFLYQSVQYCFQRRSTREGDRCLPRAPPGALPITRRSTWSRPAQARGDRRRQPRCLDDAGLAGRLLGGRADAPLLRAHRARRRGDDREPGRGQGRVRRLQRPPRRLEVVLGGPHHDGLHQHAGLHGAAREHREARRPRPRRTTTR